MGHNQEAEKEREEEACVQVFVNWYNSKYRTNLTFKRTEQVFPQLANSTRWDFTVTKNDKNIPWYAVEVKRLIRPQTKVQLVRWNKLLKSVTKSLIGHLQGEFLVIGVPHVELDQKALRQLRKIVAQIVLENTAKMTINKKIDLGPQVHAQFPQWPSIPHLEMTPSPHIEHRMREDSRFTIIKVSDSGCLIEPAVSPPDIHYVDDAVIQAVSGLFDPDKEGVLQANEQLGLAKSMGANKTILLLDDHLYYRSRIVQKIFATKDSHYMSNIDCIYLVKVSRRQVSRIWSSKIAAEEDTTT